MRKPSKIDFSGQGLRVFSGVLRLVTLPVALICNHSQGERRATLLLWMVHLQFIGLGYWILSQFAYAVDDSHRWIACLYIVAVCCWLADRVTLLEREENGTYLYSRFMGFPRFLPNQYWAREVYPLLLIAFGGAMGILLNAQLFGVILTGSGALMLAEIYVNSRIERVAILDARDARLTSSIMSEEKTNEPRRGVSDQELIQFYSK